MRGRGGRTLPCCSRQMAGGREPALSNLDSQLLQMEIVAAHLGGAGSERDVLHPAQLQLGLLPAGVELDRLLGGRGGEGGDRHVVGQLRLSSKIFRRFAELFTRTLEFLVGVETPVVEEAGMEGGEEDAAAVVVEVGGGSRGGRDGERREGGGVLIWLFRDGYIHCHVSMRT